MKSLIISFISAVLLFHSSAENFKQPAHAQMMSFINPETELQIAPQDTSTAKKLLFIAIYTLGPAWQTDKLAHEQAYFKEHSENLKKLRVDKKIVLGARYSDKGMIIISATDEKEARALVEQDPMVMNEIFNLELYPFSPFYKGCIQ